MDQWEPWENENGDWEVGYGDFTIANQDDSEIAFARKVDCELAIISIRDAGIPDIEHFCKMPNERCLHILYRYLAW